MATPMLGLGSVIKVDEDDSGATLTTVTLVIKATPPAREREMVDKTALADTLETSAGGVEKASSFMFTQYWEPEDTQHASIDTLFDSKNQVLWNIVYANTSTTDSFEGIVEKLEPTELVNNQHNQRNVTVRRQTAITRT
jgi:hypothetical protein